MTRNVRYASCINCAAGFDDRSQAPEGKPEYWLGAGNVGPFCENCWNAIGPDHFHYNIPLKRWYALTEVHREREAQDRIWRDSKFPVMNAQYDYAAPHILVIEECVDKLRKIWYGAKDEGTLRERFVKIAACALRALEEIKHTRG